MPRKVMPEIINCIINTPRITPLILPVPPTKETPPITAAEIASAS